MLRPRVKEDAPGLAPSILTREVRRSELLTLHRLWCFLHSPAQRILSLKKRNQSPRFHSLRVQA